MPKEIHEIKTFLSGTITTPDSKDIPEDAAESSLNIDPVSSDGRLMGIGTDETILEEEESIKLDSMGMINFNGERIIVGSNDIKNNISTIRDLYSSNDKNIETHNIGNITKSSLIIDNNQAYIGLGGSNLSSRPKFAGIVTNNSFTDSDDNSILIEDAEAKRLDAGYYGVRKIATTISATDSQNENTGADEDNYLWGLAPDEKFLFRITVDDATKGSSGNDGTLIPSDYIKDSEGGLINSTIMSIATCISQNNMLWATTKDGKILRLHVNADTKAITVETEITPKYVKFNEEITSTGSDMINSHNFNNKPPPENAILSDIIEARSADGTNYDLIISFWKEGNIGFAPRESYMYKRSITNWTSIEHSAGETDEPPLNIQDVSLDVNGFIKTRVMNQNILFKDISIIFDEYTTRTTHFNSTQNTNNISNEVTLACRHNNEGNIILTNLRQSDTVSITGMTPNNGGHSTGYFYDGKYCKGYKDFEYRDQVHYDYEEDDGIYTPIYNTENSQLTSKHLVADSNEVPDYVTSERITIAEEGRVYDLGRNIGFEEGFRLRVHRFGLIACNESGYTGENLNSNVLVHLYATADKKFCTKAGKIIRYNFRYWSQTFHHAKLFFGVPNQGMEEEHFNNGFFISVNTSKKVHPKNKHLAKEHAIYPNIYDDIYLASSSIPWGTDTSGRGANEELGSCFLNVLSRTNATPSQNTGGFSWLSPSRLESITMDRLGNRAFESLTTTNNYKTPSDNENLAFISESLPGSGEVTGNRFWSVDFDSINLYYSDNYNHFIMYGEFLFYNPFENLTIGGHHIVDGSYQTGYDFLKQGYKANGTYINYKDDYTVSGASIFSVFGSAATVGGAGASPDLFQTWYFSLYTTDSNNYSNGILPLAAAATDYNDWGTLSEDKTIYSLIEFTEVAGNGNNFEQSAKCFYKIALVYDNEAVSQLNMLQSEYTTSADCDYVVLDLKLSPNDISRRVTSIQLYRRGGTTDGDESTQWNLVTNNIPLSIGWMPVKNDENETIYYIKRIHDNNSNILGTYEKNSGLTSTEVTIHTLPNYGLSTICNSFNVVGRCYIPDMDNLTNYLFKSLAGRYNVFNISDEDSFLKLPTTPTALASFNGRLFVFDENNTYIVNTEYMIIEDELEGIGCLSQNSVVTTEFGMFFADDSNIYHYTGKETIPIANSVLKTKSGKEGWLERSKATSASIPNLVFDGNKLSLIVFYKQQTKLSAEEINDLVMDTLADNPELDVLDIISMFNENRALVYNLKNRRWDIWETPTLLPIGSAISGKDGEPIVSDSNNLVFYTKNEEDRRDWEWISKNITLGLDGKKKKFYKVSTQSNVDDDIVEYSLDNGDFQEGSVINKKAKSIQLKIKSQDNLDAKVDSITLTYRNLPTSKKNV